MKQLLNHEGIVATRLPRRKASVFDAPLLLDVINEVEDFPSA